MSDLFNIRLNYREYTSSKDTKFWRVTIFQEPISEVKTRIPLECIGDTRLIHSVSTYQILLLQQGGGQNNLFRTEPRSSEAYMWQPDLG